MTQNTVVPIRPNPWVTRALECQDDAAIIIYGAICRALADDAKRKKEAAESGEAIEAEEPVPSVCFRAACDALAVLYGGLMAKYARLEAEVERLQKRRRGWLRRWLGL